MAVRDFGDQPRTPSRPAMPASHVCLGPGLIDKDQAGRIDQALVFPPLGASAPYVRAILLARDERLFLKLIPSRRKKRLIIEVSALTPRSAARRRHSASSVRSGS